MGEDYTTLERVWVASSVSGRRGLPAWSALLRTATVKRPAVLRCPRHVGDAARVLATDDRVADIGRTI
jgi:hypothetical protein